MFLSKNVSLEQACFSGKAKISKIDNSTNDPVIIANMEAVSENCFEPIKNQFPEILLLSFYRCEELNAAVGGLPDSQHMKGQAIDIGCSNIIRNIQVLSWIQTNMLVYDQLISEYPDLNGSPSWIHISFVLPIELNRREFLEIR